PHGPRQARLSVVTTPGMAGGSALPSGTPDRRRLMSGSPLGSCGVWQSSQPPSSTSCAPRAAEVSAPAVEVVLLVTVGVDEVHAVSPPVSIAVAASTQIL